MLVRRNGKFASARDRLGNRKHLWAENAVIPRPSLAGRMLSEGVEPLDTIYSLSGEVPPIEALAYEDDASVLEPGSVVAGSIRQVCLIRKISAGGAILHVDIPIDEGEPARAGAADRRASRRHDRLAPRLRAWASLRRGDRRSAIAGTQSGQPARRAPADAAGRGFVSGAARDRDRATSWSRSATSPRAASRSRRRSR